MAYVHVLVGENIQTLTLDRQTLIRLHYLEAQSIGMIINRACIVMHLD